MHRAKRVLPSSHRSCGRSRSQEAEKAQPFPPHERPAFGESCPRGATREYSCIWHGSDLAQGAHLSEEGWYQSLCGRLH